MKFRIERHLSSDQVIERVPTEFRELAEASAGVLSENCTLVTFPHGRKDVVRGALAAKATKKLEDNEFDTLVIVAGDVSTEAEEILKAFEPVYLCLSEFPWSD